MRNTKSLDPSAAHDLDLDFDEGCDLHAIVAMLRQIARWTEEHGLTDAIHHVEEARGIILKAIQDGRRIQ